MSNKECVIYVYFIYVCWLMFDIVLNVFFKNVYMEVKKFYFLNEILKKDDFWRICYVFKLYVF